MVLTLVPMALGSPAEVAPAATVDNFIIENPYAAVDWAAFGRYRAAFHVHTTRSDGTASLRDTVLDHYNKGFDILAIHDHDVFFDGNWADGGLGAMTAAERDAIIAGTFAGPFPGAYGGSRQQSNGMIPVMATNEQSRTEHINTFWAPFNNELGTSVETILQTTADLGGLAFINHPGRYTGGMAGGAAGIAASNNPAHIARYLELFQTFGPDVLLGFELFNRLDNESRSDRILWDNMLALTMPYGRTIWGFSNDDSHSLDQAGYNWNVMLMPELTDAATRTAMETGAFYMVSRVTRGVAATETAINAAGIPSGGMESTLWMLEQTPPSIQNIVVVGNLITITGANYDRIEWIADGAIIHTGGSLDVYAHQANINSYVRAQLVSDSTTAARPAYGGIAMTQPFGIRPAGTEWATLGPNDLESIEPIPARRVRNGAPVTEAGLRLPANVTVTTARGWRAVAPITWNLAGLAYDPTITDVDQTFTVPGTITLPASVTNGDSVSLAVSVDVTVEAWREIVITPISEVQAAAVGETFVVRGWVSGPYNVFASGADDGFFLRDGTGSKDAIFVRLTTDQRPPVPGARTFVDQFVEVEGVRQRRPDVNAVIQINALEVEDSLTDILILDPADFPELNQISQDPTPVELADLVNEGFRSQFVSLDRILIAGPAWRTGPAMPNSNWLVADPDTGYPLVMNSLTGEIIPFTPGDQNNPDNTTFSINFAADYELLGFDRPLDYVDEPVWITVRAANIHWWNSRGEVQIRFVDPIERWDEIVVDPPDGWQPPLPFTDLEGWDAWAIDAIRYVYNNNVMQGNPDGTFSPGSRFLRPALAATLYRIAYGPIADYPYADTRQIFDDVPMGEWFTGYVAWAYDNDIVRGLPGNVFGVNNNLTREAFATMLFRFADYMDFDTELEAGPQWENFTDLDQISDWAVDELLWANSHGFITGRTTTVLSPGGTANRAEAAAILARFLQWASSN